MRCFRTPISERGRNRPERFDPAQTSATAARRGTLAARSYVAAQVLTAIREHECHIFTICKRARCVGAVCHHSRNDGRCGGSLMHVMTAARPAPTRWHIQIALQRELILAAIFDADFRCRLEPPRSSVPAVASTRADSLTAGALRHRSGGDRRRLNAQQRSGRPHHQGAASATPRLASPASPGSGCRLISSKFSFIYFSFNFKITQHPGLKPFFSYNS